MGKSNPARNKDKNQTTRSSRKADVNRTRNVTSNSNSRSQNARSRKEGIKSKDLELNVPDSAVNKADLAPFACKSSMKGGNDKQWYHNVPGLLENAASYPFNLMLGLRYPPYTDIDTVTGPTSTIVCHQSEYMSLVPGIMRISYMQTIGPVNYNTDAPNISAQQVYSVVRRANSGASNYDKTDLFMLITAMGSAYSLYAELVRAYRVMGNYSYENRYMPDSLLKALGYEPELKNNLAEFRAAINLFAYKLASINIPDEFDFIKRWMFMNSNVYTDQDSMRSQLYVFKPLSYYVWSEGQESQPTQLSCYFRHAVFSLTKDTELVSSIAQIYHAINYLMDPLLGSADVGNMSGDIMKAYSEGNCISVAQIDESNWLTPVFNMEVINELMNADWLETDLKLNTASNLVNNDITQELTSLTSGPMLRCNIQFVPEVGTVQNMIRRNTCFRHRKHLLNIKNQPTQSDDVITFTRFMFTMEPVEDTTSSSNALKVVSCGTEIITNVAITTVPVNSSPTVDPETAYIKIDKDMFWSGTALADVNTLATQLAAVGRLSSFDCAPIAHFWATDGKTDPDNKTNWWYVGDTCDHDQFIYLSDDDVENLNRVATMSLFATRNYS